MLNANQLATIEAMLAHPAYNNKQIAELVGIHNNTISKWKRIPEFTEELQKRMKQQWKDAEMVAQRTMIDLAGEGSFQASKYILDNMGYAPTTKIEADVNTDINIKIGD